MGKQQRHSPQAQVQESDNKETLVISTHGIVKKVSKVPKAEIDKAEKIRTDYLKEK